MTCRGTGRLRVLKRSRAALGWALAGFAALQVGLALAIGFFVPALNDPVYGSKASRLGNRTRTGPHRPLTVVMLGSSRTVFGLRGKDLEERLTRELHQPVVAFNFGVYGAGPVTEMLYARRLFAQGIRPDLLLIEAMPPLLDGKHARPWEADYLRATRLRSEEVAPIRTYGCADDDSRPAWWQTLSVPCYFERFNLLNYFAPGLLPDQARMERFAGMDDSGWVPMPLPPLTTAQRRQATALAHQEYVSYLTRFRLGGPACRALHDLLSLVRQKRIAGALVLMPEGKQFRSWYSRGARRQIQSFLDDLGRQFDVPVIDARTWIADRDFADSHHLLPGGARLFSCRLEREVCALLRPRGRRADSNSRMVTALSVPATSNSTGFTSTSPKPIKRSGGQPLWGRGENKPVLRGQVAARRTLSAWPPLAPPPAQSHWEPPRSWPAR